MKRYKNLVRLAVILLLTMLTSNSAWAGNTKVTVWLKDGTKTDVLFANNPVIKYASGTVTMESTSGNKSWPLAQLRKLTFGEGQTIQVETEEGDAVKMDIDVETSYADKEAVITSAGVSGTETDKSTLALPSEVEVYGETYKVTVIADNLMKDQTDVTDIHLPESDEPLKIGKDALKIDDDNVATIHSPLAHLDDYAIDEELKQNVDAGKLTATVKAPSHYWTFSCGINVVLPDNIKVYKCVIADNKVQITIIEDKDLMIDGKRILKANNGVLVACPDDDTVNAYEIVAHPDGQTVIDADSDAKSYGENWLEPVIKSKSYPANEYYVLKDNEFHAIDASINSAVPACKAVLKKPATVFAARILGVVGDDTTDISSMISSSAQEEGYWYNLNGQRIEKPTAKGVYINKGKKVIIK